MVSSRTGPKSKVPLPFIVEAPSYSLCPPAYRAGLSSSGGPQVGISTPGRENCREEMKTPSLCTLAHRAPRGDGENPRIPGARAAGPAAARTDAAAWGSRCHACFNDTATGEIYTLSLHDAPP